MLWLDFHFMVKIVKSVILKHILPKSIFVIFSNDTFVNFPKTVSISFFTLCLVLSA